MRLVGSPHGLLLRLACRVRSMYRLFWYMEKCFFFCLLLSLLFVGRVERLFVVSTFASFRGCLLPFTILYSPPFTASTQAISPEHLPVEYGGTAQALPRLPVAVAGGSAGSDTQSAGVAGAGDSTSSGRSLPGGGDTGSGARGSKSSALNKPRSGKIVGGGGLLHAILFLVNGGGGNSGGGADRRPFGSRTSYEIGGSHAIALLLTLWALHRECPRLGESALLALAAALLAREFVGGPATLPSSRYRVPLLHDPGALVAAASKNGGRSSSGDDGGCGGDSVGAGGSLAAVAGTARLVGRDGEAGVGGLDGVSLVGAAVEVVEVVGRGKSGFDRFCIRVMEASQTVS